MPSKITLYGEHTEIEIEVTKLRDGGITYKEIGRRFGLTKGQVATVLNKAKSRRENNRRIRFDLVTTDQLGKK